MSITLHLNLVLLVTYLVIGIVVALVAGALVGMRSGLGFFVTAIFAALGAWIFSTLIGISVVGDWYVAGVPLIRAILGAIIFGLLSMLMFSRRRVAI